MCHPPKLDWLDTTAVHSKRCMRRIVHSGRPLKLIYDFSGLLLFAYSSCSCLHKPFPASSAHGRPTWIHLVGQNLVWLHRRSSYNHATYASDVCCQNSLHHLSVLLMCWIVDFKHFVLILAPPTDKSGSVSTCICFKIGFLAVYRYWW